MDGAAADNVLLAAEIQRIRDEATDACVNGYITSREYAARWKSAQLEAERLLRRRQRIIPVKLRRELLAQSCAYCGDEATCVDHILPVSRGGTRDRSNLAPACKRCNDEKLDFTPAEWQAYRRELGKPWPPPTWSETLAAIAEGLLG